MTFETIARARALVVLGALALAPVAEAQMMTNPYGDAIGVETARKAAAAAVAEGKKNGWFMAVAVVDTHGDLVFYEKTDGTQYGSIQVSQDKARSAALFKRPTKSFEDAIKGGNTQLLKLTGAYGIEGGLPIIVGGKIVGAIGVSGATSAQDAQCARAGLEAIGAAPIPAAAAAPTAPK